LHRYRWVFLSIWLVDWCWIDDEKMLNCAKMRSDLGSARTFSVQIIFEFWKKK
jgi:hypothetical protein